MASSSSKSPVPIPFAAWSIKMKDHLTSKGLWDIVKNGYMKPQPMEELNAEEKEKLKENLENDLKALFLIHKSLGPSMSCKICNAAVAKEAWGTLHQIYEINDAACAPERLPSAKSTRPDTKRNMNEPPKASNGGPSAQPLRRTNSTNLEDNLHFDMVLTKTAVKPFYILRFQARVASMLPADNVIAVVRCAGVIYKFLFYGKRKSKQFGLGWRRIIDRNNLAEGDKLSFEVVKCNSNELEINIHILRRDVELEPLEESTRKEHHDPLIIVSDSDHDDDDDNEYEDSNELSA